MPPSLILCLNTQVIQNPVCGLTARDHRGRHASAGACAGAGEVQVVVLGMPVVRAEVAQLAQVMAQPMGGAFDQIITLAPGERREVHFEFDVLLEIVNAQGPQAAKDVLPCPVTDRAPILLAVGRHMPDGDDGSQGVLSAGCHCWVEPRRGMDIKTGIGWQVQVPDDAFEVLAVVIRQEERVRGERLVRLIYSQKKLITEQE